MWRTKCHVPFFFVLRAPWRHLWSITLQTQKKMKSICQINSFAHDVFLPAKSLWRVSTFPFTIPWCIFVWLSLVTKTIFDVQLWRVSKEWDEVMLWNQPNEWIKTEINMCALPAQRLAPFYNLSSLKLFTGKHGSHSTRYADFRWVMHTYIIY